MSVSFVTYGMQRAGEQATASLNTTPLLQPIDDIFASTQPVPPTRINPAFWSPTGVATSYDFVRREPGELPLYTCTGVCIRGPRDRQAGFRVAARNPENGNREPCNRWDLEASFPSALQLQQPAGPVGARKSVTAESSGSLPQTALTGVKFPLAADNLAMTSERRVNCCC